MSNSTVAIVRCNDYHPDRVYAAMRRGVDLLGGPERLVRPGERILLKPNILAGDPPETATATHPAVLAAWVRLLREQGATVAFGDSPGMENAAHAAAKAGLTDAAARAGAELGDFSAAADMDNPGGRLVPSFPIARAVHQCDGLINLPKMKTHQLTRITGAVKNLFGCIPGKRKAMYHVQFHEVTDFCSFLVELSLRLRPRLHVLDGIVAMEGNGPRSGETRPMNVLLLSADPIALDATFARLVNLDPTYVPTIALGQQMGLGTYREEEIAYLGDPLDSLMCRDYRLVRKPVYANASYAYYPWLKNLIVPRPHIDAAKCTHCGLCVKACPVPEKAVRFNGHGRACPPEYDYERCIRCYCCHEMCPNRAIEKVTPLLGRVLQLA